MAEKDNEEKQKSNTGVVWLYFIPVYLIAAYMLFGWVKKISSPKIELSPLQESAFTAPVRVRKILPQDIKKSKETEEKIQRSLEKTPRELMKERLRQKAADKKFKVIGSTPGKLLEAVEYAYRNPPAIKALFNNEVVIENFAKRETVKPILEDISKLKTFLTDTQKVGGFLDNPTVTKVINNPQVLAAISESGLVTEILTSSSVQKLIEDKDLQKEITAKNPRLNLLTANFNLLERLKSNQYTKHIAAEYTE